MRKDELPQMQKRLQNTKQCSELELFGFLPVVFWVAKVTVRGRLEVDGLLEVQLTD